MNKSYTGSNIHSKLKQYYSIKINYSFYLSIDQLIDQSINQSDIISTPTLKLQLLLFLLIKNFSLFLFICPPSKPTSFTYFLYYFCTIIYPPFIYPYFSLLSFYILLYIDSPINIFYLVAYSTIYDYLFFLNPNTVFLLSIFFGIVFFGLHKKFSPLLFLDGLFIPFGDISCRGVYLPFGLFKFPSHILSIATSMFKHGFEN